MGLQTIFGTLCDSLRVGAQGEPHETHGRSPSRPLRTERIVPRRKGSHGGTEEMLDSIGDRRGSGGCPGGRRSLELGGGDHTSSTETRGQRELRTKSVSLGPQHGVGKKWNEDSLLLGSGDGGWRTVMCNKRTRKSRFEEGAIATGRASGLGDVSVPFLHSPTRPSCCAWHCS
jgi:hypothetical protein